MQQLDRSKDYSTVWGRPGVAFSQNGQSFNARGEPITPEIFATLKPIQEADNSPTPDDGSIPKCYMADEKAPIKTADLGNDPSNLHWTQLRAMLQVYGEEFTTKEAAVKFLKGQK